MIQKEVGWQFPRLSYPAKTTNCYLNFISVHRALKRYGYTHYHVEMSKLIREGLMTRAEALEQLRADFSTRSREDCEGGRPPRGVGRPA